MKKTINKITDTLLKIFDEREIEKIAYRVGFYRRSGKITPIQFLSICIFHCEDILNNSLTSLTTTLNKEYKIEISETGINKRFTETAVRFLEVFLDLLINTKLPKNRFENCCFNKIRIADSTIIKLPEKFHDIYPGSGPKSGKDLEKQFSAIKIQHEFDMLSGQILDIKIQEGNKNDALYLEDITPRIRNSELCLRDLGYHKISDLQKIEMNGGYFISKIKLNSAMYSTNFRINPVTKEVVQCKLEKERRIYIEQLYQSLNPGDTLSIDNILLGYKEKFPCRLIIYKLTNECKGVKEENIIYNLKKKRLKSSIYVEENVDIVTYITNIPNDICKAEHIYDFYSLRWQIEIMFKCWKSIFNIDRNKNMKLDRFRCGLIGTLLSIALANNIYNELKTSFYIETGESLSELKGFRMIKDYFSLLHPSLLKGKKFIKSTLGKIGQQLKKKCKKSRKKKQFMAEDKVKYAII